MGILKWRVSVKKKEFKLVKNICLFTEKSIKIVNIFSLNFLFLEVRLFLSSSTFDRIVSKADLGTLPDVLLLANS